MYSKFIKIDETFLNNIPKINELYKNFLSIKHNDFEKLKTILINAKYNKLNGLKFSKILTKICL